jgi:hypothetical protein
LLFLSFFWRSVPLPPLFELIPYQGSYGESPSLLGYVTQNTIALSSPDPSFSKMKLIYNPKQSRREQSSLVKVQAPHSHPIISEGEIVRWGINANELGAGFNYT